MPRQKRLAEIMFRKEALKKELVAGLTEQRMKEINDEADALIAEETQLRKEIDLEGKLTAHSESHGNEVGTESETEKRGKDLREKRAVLISSESLATPSANQQIINQVLGTGNSVVDKVKFTNCYGMSEYKVPYIISEATAVKSAENTPASGTDTVFGYASLKPVTLTTYSEISSEATKLTNVDYYAVVQESARKALRRKISEYIVNSDSNSNPVFCGINSADAIDDASDISIKAIDEKTLRTIAMNYGGADDIVGEGILVLTKKDLVKFGDVRGSDKKPVYDITPDSANTNTGIIKDGGLSVRYSLNSNIKDIETASAGDYIMYYGVPDCYEIGMFSDFTVKVSEDAAFKNRMIAVLGEVMIGGNVVYHNGFTRIKKADA